MRPKIVVQPVDDVGYLQVLGRLDRPGKVFPERAHHCPPLGPAAGDVVQLLLQPGGEARIHVSLEEADQEGGDEAATVGGLEAPFVERDVFAVL